MNPNEAARLARQCIPAMRRAGETIADDLENNLKASDVKVKSMCRLWAGMGYIYDVSLLGGRHRLVIKKVSPQPQASRRSIGDRRKADSYLVEANFYEKFAGDLLDKGLAVPTPYHVERGANDEVTICMSRLEGRSGYGEEDETRSALRWLATLHAATWGDAADKAVEKGLQPNGTYWYLDTRPDEHASMPMSGWQGRLKRAARAIDGRLKRDNMQCCVHGDAKDANMLWSKTSDGASVAMCDFQYIGKAPPTLDLAYFFCVAAHDTNEELVEFYHSELIKRLEPGIQPPTLKELKESLSLAFCDWARFMSGWGFWGSDLSSEVTAVLDRLDGGRDLGSEEAYEEAVRREYG
jgi:hypothetical protein